MRVGVDIGGTFTDLVLSEDGQLKIHKLPSTPANPAAAMLAGLAAISGGRTAEHIAHGSTVATNAILERKGAKTALITTQCFRDLLFIGRQNRPELYALQPQLPPPLTPRELCYEVPERLDHSGAVLRALDYDVLDGVLDAIAAQQVEAVAVCLLYSFENPAHELAIRERIVSRGILAAWQVALSHEVLPEFREYERASTVALEAYVRPVMGLYIANLEANLPGSVRLRIMKSDGGVMSAGRVRQQAIQTALSGPAAGVIGAYHIAQAAGYPNVITLDMGGTSTDVAVCPGDVAHRPQSEIDGLPLRIRLLDIETIGAGGGSIARVDAGGALRVGPQSAGADPGPVVYGRGGEQVTVSDANALLGRLDADNFLGGEIRLALDAAETTLERLSQQTGLSLEATAQGVIDIANTNIDRALRRVTVARGHDPRDFTLVAFGGAGALHACAVAEGLEIPRVLIPRYPGVLCALGLLVADVTLEYSDPVMQIVTMETEPRLRERVTDWVDRAAANLRAEGAEGSINAVPTLDARYQGQAYELNIPFRPQMDIAATFHAAHEATYGYKLADRPVEIVNLRLRAISKTEKLTLERAPLRENITPEPIGQKHTRDGQTLNLYQRDSLSPGVVIQGPGLVFQLDSTVYIAPGWAARVDQYRNLILEGLTNVINSGNMD